MRSCLYNLKRAHASKLIGLIGTAGGLTILLAFPIGKSEPATPTIKVPGSYPYETPARVPTPPIAELSPAPSPAPFPYPEYRPRSRLLRLAIHERHMPAARSPLKPCARQHSNTMECQIFVDSWQHSLPMLVCSIQNLGEHANL